MNTYEEHRILHHLDNPLRIFFWTVDEFAIMLLPLIIGIGIGYGITGFFVSILGFFAVRKIKKHFGVGNLRQLIYWYFPHNYKKLKNTPPSHVREYLT